MASLRSRAGYVRPAEEGERLQAEANERNKEVTRLTQQIEKIKSADQAVARRAEQKAEQISRSAANAYR
jgi:hypothetical protein